MRKLALGMAVAAGALTIAAPAAAQWRPQPAYGYGYAQPAYGYGSGGFARAQEVRVAAIRSQVRNLGTRRVIGYGQARALDREAFNLERRIRASAWRRNGPGQGYAIDRQIARLEQRVQIASLRSRYAPRYAYGYGRRW